MLVNDNIKIVLMLVSCCWFLRLSNNSHTFMLCKLTEVDHIKDKSFNFCNLKVLLKNGS